MENHGDGRRRGSPQSFLRGGRLVDVDLHQAPAVMSVVEVDLPGASSVMAIVEVDLPGHRDPKNPPASLDPEFRIPPRRVHRTGNHEIHFLSQRAPCAE